MRTEKKKTQDAMCKRGPGISPEECSRGMEREHSEER